LDIKGMTEWEEIREARRLKTAAEATEKVEEETAATAVAVLDVPEAEVQEADAPAATDTQEESPVAVVDAETVEVAGPVGEKADEDEILEALIREEEGREALEAAATGEASSPSFSVDDLDSFTLGDVGTIEDDEEQDEKELVLVPDSPAMAVVTPDAGKIRFAEDLIEDARGGGRRNNRARRGGAARKGPANRGGGR